MTHPAFATLRRPTWDAAFRALLEQSHPSIGAGAADDLRTLVGDRALITQAIPELIESLYARGTVAAGELALAWSMLRCSPSRPASFRGILPQLQAALDCSDMDSDDHSDLRDRLRIWWRAARGDFADRPQQLSMHSLAETELTEMQKPQLAHAPPRWFSAPYPGPTLVVMPRAKATKLGPNTRAFESILDKPLPLAVARNLTEAQRKLGYQFPHCSAALSALFRDLREGKPARLRPTILVGPPGCSKSRLVRKFAAAIGVQHVHRVDGGASGDNHFGGVSKSWSTTEPSVPARAVLASRTGNPLILVDELDKGSPRGGLNGTLWEALAGLTEAETAARFRDPSLDAELDLSGCLYLCTANDVSALPDFLRDRFRILKVPAPRLVDLPLLAGSIVDDMLKEDEWGGFVAPFAPDELQVMAKAWEKAKFSMRKLQKIVRATLEARDAHAMRH
ncbi:AAA family ATPase [Bradyrhizobium sp. RDM12]